jgi:hypothetical protein
VAEQSTARETITFRPKVELSPKAQELFGTPPAMTGTDYLPADTLARAQKGSFLEKVRASMTKHPVDEKASDSDFQSYTDQAEEGRLCHVARGARASCPPPLRPIYLVRTLFLFGEREGGREGGKEKKYQHHTLVVDINHSRPLPNSSFMHMHGREELDLATETDDMDQRLKYAGIFHRRKRTPGRFMMRYVSCMREGGREGGREASRAAS